MNHVPIKFQSNPLFDVTLFSGKEIKCERQLERSPGSQKLIGKAREKALADLKQSYEKHKEGLGQLRYGQFLRLVEESLGAFKSAATPSDVRDAVAKKLSELAKERIQGNETSFSWIHKFFHKLGQLFCGHGFRTEGEYGVFLAKKMKKIEPEDFLAKLKTYTAYPVFFDLGDKSMEQVLGEMKGEINALPKNRFIDLTLTLLRRPRELRFDHLEFAFCQNLNEEKRELFGRVICSWNEWFSRVFEIVDGIDPNRWKEVVSKEMVRTFLLQRRELDALVKGHPNGRVKEFFKVLFEAAVKECLDRDDFATIEVLSREGLVRLDKIEKSPHVLAPEDFEKLRGNIDLQS